MQSPFLIGESEISAGSRALIDLPVASLSNHTPVTLPVHVVHGFRSGPVIFVSAAIHGDEILGIEIIRRLLGSEALAELRGTLLCVPIVNAFGFISQSRYLPDRRDLNRSFPGSATGSLAGQVAHCFLNQVVARAEFGIDLHTGAINRSNLPQLRGDFTCPELRNCAVSFGAPVCLQSRMREGSLREAASRLGIDVLLYEADEALRLDEFAIRVGLRGILNVLQHRKMLPSETVAEPITPPIFSRSSRWIRAPIGGLFRASKPLGEVAAAGETIGQVTNPYDGSSANVDAVKDGLIIGRIETSVVNQADALFHIADVRSSVDAEGRIEAIADEVSDDPIFDEDEIT